MAEKRRMHFLIAEGNMAGIDSALIDIYVRRSRPDYSTCVTHWTKNMAGRSAFDVLKKILADRRIIASTRESGFIKGDVHAACFTEIPLTTMARAFVTEGQSKIYLKWAPYALAFQKRLLYLFGGRPALYLDDKECAALCPEGTVQGNEFLWRVVRFDLNDHKEAVDFSHEREWRVPGDVEFGELPKGARPIAIVDKWEDAEELQRLYPDADTRPFFSIFCLAFLRGLG